MVKKAQLLEDAMDFTDSIKGKFVKKELTSGQSSARPNNGKKHPLNLTEGPSQERKPKAIVTYTPAKSNCKHCDKLGHTADECWRKVSACITVAIDVPGLNGLSRDTEDEPYTQEDGNDLDSSSGVKRGPVETGGFFPFVLKEDLGSRVLYSSSSEEEKANYGWIYEKPYRLRHRLCAISKLPSLPAKNFLRAFAPIFFTTFQNPLLLKTMAISGVSDTIDGYGAAFLTVEQQERFTTMKTKMRGNKIVDIVDLEKNGMHSIIAAMQ
ncbi:hypothetical protein Taro_048862 [Colocasia esculenta]|uniref:CCHC-type domain-containing protein n=1 Tax=Colocasia esculenta TaxID=4460 RepID=A0A843X987_COLES|nr:hypothetical protein [Colocasia esculenta]